MYKFILLAAIFYIAHINEVNALKCKLCVGSPTSDCARDVESSIVMQECLQINTTEHHGHGHRYNHHHYHHGRNFETTTMMNDDEFEGTTEQSTTEDSDVENVSENDDIRNGANFEHPKLETSCAYLKVRASNVSTALVTRGCSYFPKNQDLCQVIRKHNKNIVQCKTCTTDECN